MFKRQSAGRLGSPAGPAASSSSGRFLGQRNSEPQLSAQRLYLLTHWHTLILPSTLNKLNSGVRTLLTMHFPIQLISISEIMCQTHAFAVGLLSVYLSEKFTHSPMSQTLRASDAL